MNTVTTIHIQTAAEWAASQMVLHTYEIGRESDTGKEKRGDGLGYFSALSYLVSPGSGGGDMLSANNLSDVASTVTSRLNILPSIIGNANKFLQVNAGETDYVLTTLTGGGDMLGANNLTDVANSATALANLGGISDISGFDTDDLAEGATNLYFTSARAITALTGQNVSILTNDAGYITDLSSFSTTDLAEGTNLYFTNARAVSATAASYLSASNTSTQSGYFGALLLKDQINPSHYLNITLEDDLTATRNLQINVADGNKLLTISGNATISGTHSGTSSGTNTGDNAVNSLYSGLVTMTYPGAGIALSTGSAWDTSIVDNSGNWNTAFSWGNHASAGYLTIAAAAAAYQPLDADLTTIAGLTATTDNFMVATASAWASRTPTQARSQLGLGTLATQSGTFSGTSSGTNTGDQTSIVGITGTKAQYNTSNTDGDFLFVGDITQYTDEMAQDAIGAMVDGTLIYTDATPTLSRAALTGDATASAGSNAIIVLQASTSWAKTGELTPAQITSNVDNYAPTGHGSASIFYLDTDATRTMSGMAGGSAGLERTFVYIGSNTLTLLNNNAGSSVGNKFSILGSFSLTAGCSATFHHDGTFWRLVSWTGVLGGDLSGTFPNPTVGNGKITEAKLSIADNTTANFTTSAHGFVPKGTNIGSVLLDNGNWGSQISTCGVATSPTASQTDTITHGLGRTPVKIRIYGIGTFTSNAAATPTTCSMGVWNSTGNRCVFQGYNTAAITTTQASGTSTSFAIRLDTGANSFITGIIGTVGATTFAIAWTETGTATAQNYMWEAE